MNVNRFRKICNISSYVLKAVAIFDLFILVFGVYTIFFGDGNFWFNYSGPSFTLLNASGSMSGAGMSDADQRTAALILVPLIILVTAFVFWKGGQLFQNLANGEKPFTEKFAKSIKRLSLVLIIFDLLMPILYSIVISFIYEDGYYFILGVGSPFIIGVILYAISEIFYYGIELQHLSDETV